MTNLQHPHFETQRQRDRRLAREEVNRWIDHAADLRKRWDSGRILPSVH